MFVKDPGAVIDYAVSWGAGYLSGEDIINSDWLVAPAEPEGLTVPASRIEPGATVATLAGGRAGHVYRVANRISLSSGRCDERTLVVDR
jgi:hypothetical protein